VQTLFPRKLPCLAIAALLSCVLPHRTWASPAATTPRASSEAVHTLPAAVFVRSFGVNVHMEYTDGHYADAARVLMNLGYLGMGRVRDGVPRPDTWLPHGQGIQALNLLATAGIRFDFAASSDSDIPFDRKQLDAFEQEHPGSVLSVEGPNEINNWPMHHAGMTNEQAATEFQRTLYRSVHGDPLLAHVSVLYYTGGAPIDLANHRGLADAANTHPYPQNGDQPYFWLQRDYNNNFKMPRGPDGEGYPWQITETGYYTLPSSRNWGGVDDATQAKLLLNLMFDARLEGAETTYIYQLLDPYPYNDPRGSGIDGHLGLFGYDGQPKPSATAIRNLFTFLSTAGTVRSPQSVHYSVSGLPATGHTLALTRADGSLVIALWNETPAWDEDSAKPLHPAAVKVRVTVPGVAAATAVLENPLSGKQEAVAGHAHAYEIDVPDSPVLLTLFPHR
jgi:hypothetical protein